MFTLVSALASAGAYAPERPINAVQPDQTAQATTCIHHARVEIYCGHNAAEIADIRSAQRGLQTLTNAMAIETQRALDQAAWLTRQGQYKQAQLALQAALGHLA